MMLRSMIAIAAAGGIVALVLDRLVRRKLRARLPTTVALRGCGDIGIMSTRSGGNTLVTLNWDQVFGKLPFNIPFCSAVLADDGTIHVSGSIGLAPPANADSPPSIVAGGPKQEMIRTMEVIEACLKACGAEIENITMAHCYLTDYTKERCVLMRRRPTFDEHMSAWVHLCLPRSCRFAEMNQGYLEFMSGHALPARITVGCTALALGACVEVDVTAKKPV